MSDEIFRLPASSYDELVKIIRGYGSHQNEASLDDVSRTSAINRTTISGNNGFLASVGIIEGGNKKSLTTIGRDLAKALDYEMPDEITEKWGNVVDATEFLKQVLSAVRIRKGMEESALRAHVAYTAGQPKRSGVMTGAGTVVEILRAAGRVVEKDNKLIAVTDVAQPPTGAASRLDGSPAASVTTPAQGTPAAEVNDVVVKRRGMQVALNINIQINGNSDELDGLGGRLRKLIDALEAPVGDETEA